MQEETGSGGKLKVLKMRMREREIANECKRPVCWQRKEKKEHRTVGRFIREMKKKEEDDVREDSEEW